MFKKLFNKSAIIAALLISLVGGSFAFAQSLITNAGISAAQVLELIEANAPVEPEKISIPVKDASESCATGDLSGNVFFTFPSDLAGSSYNLVGVMLSSHTAGTTGTMTVQIHNVTQGADMLSTRVTVDSAEKTSLTAATPAVIDTSNDDVAKGDEIRVDIDTCHTTPSLGVQPTLYFEKA